MNTMYLFKCHGVNLFFLLQNTVWLPVNDILHTIFLRIEIDVFKYFHGNQIWIFYRSFFLRIIFIAIDWSILSSCLNIYWSIWVNTTRLIFPTSARASDTKKNNLYNRKERIDYLFLFNRREVEEEIDTVIKKEKATRQV
jgi:hypothetical protein